MSQETLGLTHERKFLLKRAQAENFFAQVAPRLTLDVYDLERPISFSRTTYLDTDDLEYYRSCEGPVARRLRIREYAAASNLDQPPTLTGVSFLELKESAGPLRSKARFAAPADVIAEIVAGGGQVPRQWEHMLAQLQPFQAIVTRMREGCLKPRLTTWYRRASLSGERGRVRVTLDEAIAFCKPGRLGGTGVADPGQILANGPGRVLEVKSEGEPPRWLTEAMVGLPETPEFSKFRVGMETLVNAAPYGGDGPRSTKPLEIPSALRVSKGQG